MRRAFPTYPLLQPAAWLYGLAVRLRNLLFNRGVLRETAFPLPVICVGNLSIGGTGKTPHVEHLLRLLSPGRSVAVLSRGYGRKTKGFRLVAESDAAEAVGDEPLQMKRRFPGVTVAVDGDRVEGLRRLTERPAEAPDVVVLDDAFQHRYVKPGLSLLLTDYSRLFPLDRLLPAGRLREPASGKRRADVLVVTKCPPDLSQEERDEIRRLLDPLPRQRLFFTFLRYAPLRPFESGPSPAEIPSLVGRKVLVITGIARHEPLLDHLRAQGAEVTSLAFRDHHAFTPADVRRINAAFELLPPTSRLAVTTEKDAVRLAALDGLSPRLVPALYVQPVETAFIGDETQVFNQFIIDYVTTNSANCGVD